MKNLLTFTFLLLFAIPLMGQTNNSSHDITVDFDDLAVLNVVSTNPTTDVILNASWGINVAGEEVSVGTYLDSNSVNRLHYSVFSPEGGNKDFNISVQTTGFDGAGWTIDLELLEGNFPNTPSKGTPISSVDLRAASSSVDVVDGIHKIAWTGTDISTDGWGLKYKLKVTDMNTFEGGSNTTNPIIVTYTIYED